MSTLTENLNRRLAELRSRDLFRELRLPAGIDFSSNDYLGLSSHPAVRRVLKDALQRGAGVGSTGSRLLRGNRPEHEELEAFAARFFGCESALYFGSGYDANLALFSCLPSREDAVIHDELIHASVREGIRASCASARSARHNDVQSFADTARRARERGAKAVFLAVESVYSMDGDRVPLGDLLTLADRLDATVILDEAHATGIFGPRGRGLADGLHAPNLISVHTCGKALGVAGALIAAPAAVKDYLVNRARPFIFSTAPPPLMAAAVRRALELLDEEPWRREKLLALGRTAARAFAQADFPWRTAGDGTQIFPIILGEAAAAQAAAERLITRGFDVRAIRPPAVPESGARLRISLSCDRTEAELHSLLRAMEDIARER